jgi:2-polyprenyl-3-methyl-5-hydroxy-6-metoxy-1,4-benzoquinol methylase
MDTDCVDFADYSQCLRDLSRVNVVTMTHRPMLAWLAKQGRSEFSLLDIACGHGDALRRIRRLYPNATLAGIDLNPWATKAANQATGPEAHIDFITDDVFAYRANRKFDFLIASQFAHHLSDDEVIVFLRWLRENAGCGWFIGDLHRHVVPYYGFPVLAYLALWHRFVRIDGQISISRGFRRAEWQALLRAADIAEHEAFIAWYIPFRLCVGTR